MFLNMVYQSASWFDRESEKVSIEATPRVMNVSSSRFPTSILDQ